MRRQFMVLEPPNAAYLIETKKPPNSEALHAISFNTLVGLHICLLNVGGLYLDLDLLVFCLDVGQFSLG